MPDSATCIRIFKFLVLPGKEQEYRDYLRDVVEPIDAAAHAADVFLDIVTMTPDAPENAAWNHGRIFTFRDRQQRDAMAERMAATAARFDGSEEARDRRKRHAQTLRSQVSVADYSLS